METYNRVMAEQTEEDKKKFYHQQKKVKEFMNYTNRNLVPRLGIHNSKDYEEEQQKEIEELTAKPTGMGAAASYVPDGDFRVQTTGKAGVRCETEIGGRVIVRMRRDLDHPGETARRTLMKGYEKIARRYREKTLSYYKAHLQYPKKTRTHWQ